MVLLLRAAVVGGCFVCLLMMHLIIDGAAVCCLLSLQCVVTVGCHCCRLLLSMTRLLLFVVVGVAAVVWCVCERWYMLL